METIGSKRSYALTWCMPNNDDDDDDPMRTHRIRMTEDRESQDIANPDLPGKWLFMCTKMWYRYIVTNLRCHEVLLGN